MTDPAEIPDVAVSTIPPAPPPRRSAASVLTVLGLVLLVVAIGFVWTQTQDAVRGIAQLDMTTHRLIDGVEKSVGAQTSAVRDKVTLQLDSLDMRLRKVEQDQANPQVPPQAARPEPVANADIAGLQQRIAAVEQKLAAADTALAASRALAAGKPVGVIPGAPPALARYADSKPPTEIGLRQEFPLLSARAAEASKPATEADGVAQRMWLHVQSLVTVKDHDRVLVGAPASIVLGDAQDRLTAGDLAGAVTALTALDPAAAAVMADWVARARALLDARAAVAALPGAR
jgi:hypothetical protein